MSFLQRNIKKKDDVPLSNLLFKKYKIMLAEYQKRMREKTARKIN